MPKYKAEISNIQSIEILGQKRYGQNDTEVEILINECLLSYDFEQGYTVKSIW